MLIFLCCARSRCLVCACVYWVMISEWLKSDFIYTGLPVSPHFFLSKRLHLYLCIVIVSLKIFGNNCLYPSQSSDLGGKILLILREFLWMSSWIMECILGFMLKWHELMRNWIYDYLKAFLKVSLFVDWLKYKVLLHFLKLSKSMHIVMRWLQILDVFTRVIALYRTLSYFSISSKILAKIRLVLTGYKQLWKIRSRFQSFISCTRA